MDKKVKKIKDKSVDLKEKSNDVKNKKLSVKKEKQKKEKQKKEKQKKEKQKKPRVGFFKSIFNFCKELKGELKKIVWPTKLKLFNAIIVVVIAIVIMAVFIVFIDFVFRNLLKLLFKTF